jgi:hypothetical protein
MPQSPTGRGTARPLLSALASLALMSACTDAVEEDMPSDPPPPVSDCCAKAPGDWQIETNPLTGTPRRVRADDLSAALSDDLEFQRLRAEDRYGQIALAFLQAYRRVFRIDSPREELTPRPAQVDDLGMKHIRLDQSYRGVPVQDAQVVVHLDARDRVSLVAGSYIPTPVGLDTTPAIDSKRAQAAAAAAVGETLAHCGPCEARLIVWAPAGAAPRLAYRVDVAPAPDRAWAVTVDALTSAILARISTLRTGGYGLRL